MQAPTILETANPMTAPTSNNHIIDNRDTAALREYLEADEDARSNRDKWKNMVGDRGARTLREIWSMWPRSLLEALMNLLQYDALWTNFSLGKIAPLTAVRCTEEMEDGLCHVGEIIAHILGHGELSAEVLDTETVQQLECLMPRWSTADCCAIEKMHNEGLIFNKVTNSDQWAALNERLKSVSRIVTLDTCVGKEVLKMSRAA
ncbi:hypothetical protein M433DRAFT_160397 [Acidomyces richmondensis BFW]|nr:hypothetical protein M433DRAFT_160397 [Acidomyces richmondensis BFW]